MNRIGWAAAVLFLAAPAAHAADRSKYLLADPAAAQRVDYLIVSGDRFAGSLDALAAHREKQGHAVGIVTMSAVKAKFKTIRTFLAYAVTKWEKPPPRFLLLVGDVDAVPAVVRKGELTGWVRDRDLATDFDYARPLGDRIQLHVGRFPCDTPDELATMITKTIDYETTLPGGAWQRTLRFVASVGGYGGKIDGLLEAMGMLLATTSVPYAFDMQAAYGSPESPFCPYPPKFNANAVEMFNAGSLLYLFVGHGTPRGVATVQWNGRSYPILGERDAKSLDAKHGLPILVVIACHTGRYDDADCLGETFLKVAKGPVAFLGGSRVTQPYANGLLASALIDAFFGKAETLGEVVSQTKQAVLDHRFSLFRVQADALGAMMQGKQHLEPMRNDVVRHYNLLGDPALIIRRPKADIRVTVEGATARIAAPGRRKVDLTLECDRLMFLHRLPRLDPDDPDFEEKITDRYRKAHEKVIRRWTVPLDGGAASVEFEMPERPGRYFLKASAGASVGSAMFLVQPPPDRGEPGRQARPPG